MSGKKIDQSKIKRSTISRWNKTFANKRPAPEYGHNIWVQDPVGYNIYEYSSLWAQWGLRNVPHRALQPLACYVKHSSRPLCAVRQCARAGTAECRVAPFRGCGPKKQSISLLPTARRSFSFIDSCPPILVQPKPSPEFTNVTIVESTNPSVAKSE